MSKYNRTDVCVVVVAVVVVAVAATKYNCFKYS